MFVLLLQYLFPASHRLAVLVWSVGVGAVTLMDFTKYCKPLIACMYIGLASLQNPLLGV